MAQITICNSETGETTMFMIERTHLATGTVDRFGPFPSHSRAEDYCKQFNYEYSWEIWAIIIPNCVTVKLILG
jgi:hypothetical protein